MNRRIIPCLTWSGGDIVKTTRFASPDYIGDLYNLVRIYSEKEADELILLDIDATREQRGPDLKLIQHIASGCTVPLTYGGGLTTLEQIREVIYQGVEKVIIGNAAHTNTNFIHEAVAAFGSSTITVCIDYTGKKAAMRAAGKRRVILPQSSVARFAQDMEAAGVGEIIMHCTDRDGMQCGYDIVFIGEVAGSMHLPVIALGGAKDAEDIVRLFAATPVSAAAAGSAMVYHGPYKAVLPSYCKVPATTSKMPEWDNDF